jgi:hypothetical protein
LLTPINTKTDGMPDRTALIVILALALLPAVWPLSCASATGSEILDHSSLRSLWV